MSDSTETPSTMDGQSMQPETTFDHDWQGQESLSATIVSAIGECDERPVESLPSLADRIDPDALDTIFRRPRAAEARASDSVQFRYAGYVVDVWASGRVIIGRVPDREE